jgi:protease I
MNPDNLRQDRGAVSLVQRFAEAGKPVAAICHAPWLLIEAGLVRGRRMTGYASIRTDLRNAGAEVVDAPVVEDRGVITSRNPGDLEEFSRAVLEALA